MTNGQRTVATLLAVIAVLLGVNLIMKVAPEEASAQEPELRVEGDPRVPRVIQIEPVGTLIYRLWSGAPDPQAGSVVGVERGTPWTQRGPAGHQPHGFPQTPEAVLLDRGICHRTADH